MKTSRQTTFMATVLALSACVVTTSCGNDYDLSDLDTTIGVNADGLRLTNDNSIEIILDDILKIEGEELVKVEENGDYRFGKAPESVDPVNITINEINLGAPSMTSNPIDINLSELLNGIAIPVGSSFAVPTGTEAANIDQWLTAFNYNTTVSDEVRELEYAVINDNAVITINIPKGIKTIKNLTITLPKFLELTYKSDQSEAGGVFSAADNSVKFSTVNIPGGNGKQLKLYFTLNRFDIASFNDRNKAVFTAKTKPNDGTLTVKGDVHLTAQITELVVPSTPVLRISGSLQMGTIIINKVKGVFDPDIDLNDLGDVNIGSIPNFLQDDEVVVDLDNPRLAISLKSTLPLGGTVKAVLTSDVYPAGIHLDSGNKIVNIKAAPAGQETETRILLCRHKSGVENIASYDQVIEDDNLSKLVSSLHNGMKIKFNVTEVRASQEAKEVSTGNFKLTPSYEFSAPLAFGKDAVIVYRDTLKNWNSDLDDVKLMQGAYVELEANAVNNIPVDMNVEVQAIGLPDSRGNLPRLDGPNGELKIEHISAHAAGASPQGAGVSPIRVRITELSGNGLNKLDGITLFLKAESNEAIKGQTLNKKTQTLKLQNVNATIQGTIIVEDDKNKK